MPILVLAKRHYNNCCYFECLQCVELSLKQVKMPELSGMLQALHFNIYYHVLNCHVLSASCYYKMEQYDRALEQCDLVLQSDCNDVKANKVKGTDVKET